MKYISCSDSETVALGRKVGQSLKSNDVLCFFGDLGAGKTTFIKGLASGANGSQSEIVNSPTFVYLNIYEGKPTVYHFDLYRLRDVDEFLSMGFDEFFFAEGISCVEWSEKIAPILPEDCIRIEIAHLGESKREIIIT